MGYKKHYTALFLLQESFNTYLVLFLNSAARLHSSLVSLPNFRGHVGLSQFLQFWLRIRSGVPPQTFTDSVQGAENLEVIESILHLLL